MDKIDKKYAFKFANREHIKKASSYCPRVTNHMKKYYRKKIPKKDIIWYSICQDLATKKYERFRKKALDIFC